MTPNKWQGRIFLGRDDEGVQQYHYVGRFRTRKERNDAVALAWIDIETNGCGCKGCKAMGRKGVAVSTLPTIGKQIDRYLAWYRRENRGSSLGTQETRLKRFRKDFGDRPLDAVKKPELRDWQAGEGTWEGQETPVPVSHMPAVVSFFGWSIEEDDQPLGKNPARGLSERGKGRSEEAPPTEAEFQKLIDSCSVMGETYAPMMRAIFLFAAFELMRPSELFELKETDIDFRRNRISKSRRLYRNNVDEPKTGAKIIALTPPARDVIAPILPGDGGYVFRNLTDGQLKQNTLTAYWGKVLARADLDFDFYHATKHYGVWYFWTQLGLSDRAIAAQAGWSLKTVDAMLETYGHGDVGALDEVDAAFKDRPVTGLRVVEGGQS